MNTSMWYTLPSERVVKMLQTDARKGLSNKEVDRRLSLYGENVFEKEDRKTILDKFVAQLKNPLVLILLIAGVVTLMLGNRIDTLVIFIAVGVNIVIGLFQETRASKAFEKLASSQEHTAIVIREGTQHIVPSKTLVQGDLVVLRAGVFVPADLYLLEARELETSEAPLTGESISVRKEVGVFSQNTHMTDRHNMAWMSTLVVAGEGIGVVVATGNDTEIGHIARSLKDTTEIETPIQKNVRRLARFLSFLIIGIVGIIFILGLLRGETIETMLLLAIAVAVSVIPEGLPAAVTAVLAIGMEKILSHGGLVRNLLAAETLGSTTVILTDKTGTITQARMRLFLAVTASGVSENNFSEDARYALLVGLKASDAFIEKRIDGHEEIVRGRPIERAIVERTQMEGFDQETILQNEPRRDFLPFDSRSRFAASLNKHGDMQTLYVSGAPSALLSLSTKVLRSGKEVALTGDDRVFFREKLDEYARRGVRFVSVGYKKTFITSIPETRDKSILDDLVFVGLLGFEDPIRLDVREAIVKARGAGARIIMLTGDNPETARSIAIEAGIVGPGASVYIGSDIEAMSDDELATALKRSSVFARMLPDQKLRMVNLLQEAGEVVAMTGDGVNDSPALKRADIGVAVGSGTEVAQEASDLILLNDSFSIIVSAIEEGRRIIDNLKKSVVHMLSTSFHEVFIIAASIIAGLPVPVLAVQILWVNILEEGFLTFGFAFEPGEEGLMKRDPRSERTKTILTKEVRKLILIAGTITGVFSFLLYLVLIGFGIPIGEIRTIMFVVLSLDAIFFAISLKHLRKPFWHTNILNNRYLLFAITMSVVGIMATLSIPVIRTLLSLEILTFTELLLLVCVGIFNLLTIEMTKRYVFRNAN